MKVELDTAYFLFNPRHGNDGLSRTVSFAAELLGMSVGSGSNVHVLQISFSIRINDKTTASCSW